ncbi:MAG: DUF3617 domain-containing protein [Woeseiaceae bacterium]
MTGADLRQRARAALGAAGALLCALAWAAGEAVEPGSYEIIARTVMPHLEENLRYATIRERRCVRDDELATVFPILRHPSLAGCTLGNPSRRGGAIRYVLSCASPQVATGSARLDARAGRIAGVLEIKMGGKNMTFTQRIEGLRQGKCEP